MLGSGQVTLPAMPVPPQYAGIFNFLASSRLHYFRTVLRLSTRKQKVLRIVVIDAEGELFLYSDDGELKRQLAIPSHIDRVFADDQVVVMRIADDQDLVLDFHASRSNHPEATVRRFLTVLSAFMRHDATLEKVPRAMDHTAMGGTPNDRSLGARITKSASNLLKSTRSALGMERNQQQLSPAGSATFPRADGEGAADSVDISPPADAAAFPAVPLSPMALPSASARISRTTGPGTFRGRRNMRKVREQLEGEYADDDWQDLATTRSPPQVPAGAESADREDLQLPASAHRDDRANSSGSPTAWRSTEQFDDDDDDDGWTFQEPAALARSADRGAAHDGVQPSDHDTSVPSLGTTGRSLGAFPEPHAPLAAHPPNGDVRVAADGEASTFAATVDKLREASGLTQEAEMTDAELDAMEPHEAVGILLQELRNERVGSYLEGVVTDMHCRERELEHAVAEHKRRVAARKAEAARRREQLAQQAKSTAARQKSLEALSMLVLAACRRSQLLQQHVDEERENAEAHRDASALAHALTQRDPFDGSALGDDGEEPEHSVLMRVAVPPYVRRMQECERTSSASSVGGLATSGLGSKDANDAYRAPKRYSDVFAGLFNQPRGVAVHEGSASLRHPTTARPFEDTHHGPAQATRDPTVVDQSFTEGPNRWMRSTKFGEKLSRAYDPSILELL